MKMVEREVTEDELRMELRPGMRLMSKLSGRLFLVGRVEDTVFHLGEGCTPWDFANGARFFLLVSYDPCNEPSLANVSDEELRKELARREKEKKETFLWGRKDLRKGERESIWQSIGGILAAGDAGDWSGAVLADEIMSFMSFCDVADFSYDSDAEHDRELFEEFLEDQEEKA